MSKIVIALGGNALGTDPQQQLELLTNVSKVIVSLIKQGHEIVVTHGNGPQVGQIALAMDYAANGEVNTPDMPFAECGSMSQGYIGYQLQQSLQNELNSEGINKDCVTVVTQVLVDPKDAAFNNPTKPIGKFYTKEEAKQIEKEKGYTFVEDAGRGYRRVVPSPIPKKIIESDSIDDLISKGNLVIAVGGGGIPVILENDKLIGVDAVIDKDRSGALLAKSINADTLLILTAVDKVYINYNTPNQKELDYLSNKDAKKYIKNNQFAKGSMLPKVEACLDFVEGSEKRVAIISSLEKAKEAIEGGTGTKVIWKKNNPKKKKKEMISSYTIIFSLIVLLGIVSHFLPEASFIGTEVLNGSGVNAAKLSDIFISPILGFSKCIDIAIFIMMLGGLLKIIKKTGALENGIKALVKKLKGKELWLIPILMFIFSICGTTFGMLEETIGFYVLLAATMFAAGMDPVVGCAIIILGAGTGALGSTVNPFATGIALSMVPKGINIEHTLVMLIAVVLWMSSYLISTLYVLNYAKKVKDDKGSTILSLREQSVCEKKYSSYLKGYNEKVELSTRQIITLTLFALAFIVMILGFVPWNEFGITIFEKYTGLLVGKPLGEWWFYETAAWFLIVSILIAIVNKMNEKTFVETFVDGADDMIGVILIIALARGIGILMESTLMDNYIIYNVIDVLKTMPEMVFVPLNYIFHLLLSFLVPSSSGIATLSTPILLPIIASLGYSTEVSIMTIVSANGLANLFIPTCGAIMGGLALSKVDYSTWFKWVFKLILMLVVANMLVLCLFSL